MEGRPVWLASLSLRDRFGIIAGTATWSPTRIRKMHAALEDVLSGVGDVNAQRLFRMNVTLCLHRALTLDEEAGLSQDFCDATPIDIAGGPVEVLWENVPSRPSTRPCEAPGRQYAIVSRPDLWLPADCGQCEPCRARAGLESYRPTVAA